MNMYKGMIQHNIYNVGCRKTNYGKRPGNLLHMQIAKHRQTTPRGSSPEFTARCQ